MAAQAPSRRQMLQALACASLASGAPGFTRWCFAFAQPKPQHTHEAGPSRHTPDAAVYTSRFFSPSEYADVVLLAELILPRTPTEHPVLNGNTHAILPADAGATDAGVAEFIDFMAAHDPTLQPAFRNGLAWINTACAPGTFHALAPADQNALLTRLAFQRNFRPQEKPGQQFFALMRRYTVMGFYTSRIGLEALDYPGLGFYAESPAVPRDGFLERLEVHA